MKKRISRENSISGFFVLAVFAVFAAAVLFVLMFGVKVYKDSVRRDENAFITRTVSQYLVTKVRQADENGLISVKSFSADFKDVDAICIEEESEGIKYITRVYCYNGYIMELFSEADEDMLPEDGNEVIECISLELSEKDGLIEATIKDTTGTVTKEYIIKRSEAE